MAGRNVTARFAVEADVAQAKRDLEAVTQQIDQLGKTRVDGARQELEQLNASTSKLSTGYTALTEDQRKLYQQREQDAQQVDKLKRTYKTLEGALETLDVQVKNGWRSMEEAARLQPQLAAAYTRTGQAARQAGADLQAGTAAAKAAAAAQDAAHASTSKFGGSMSNLGYQVQDAAVQLQMGTNAFVVLAQQGSQAASAFGPLGAAIGTAVAIGGTLAAVMFGLGQKTEDTTTSFNDYAKALDFARKVSEQMRSASEGARAALEAEGRSAVDAAQKRLAKADADLKALESGMMGNGDAASSAGAAVAYLFQSSKVKELRQEIEVLRGTLGQYNDGAREVRIQTEQGNGKLREARSAIEDYRESLRQQIAETKLSADSEDLSNAGKLRAKLETEALTKARAAGRVEIDAGTRALIEELVKQQERIDALQEEEKAANKAETANATLAKARAKVVEDLDRDVAAQKRLAEIAGMSASEQREANEQTRIAAELAKAHTTASTEEGRAIAAKVKEAEKWKAVAADTKAIKDAESALEFAKKEMELTNLLPAARERAVRSLQIQREATQKWGDTTDEVKAKWIALQEQIADVQAVKRFQDDVTRVATDIGKDISENLWDQITGQAKAGDALQFFKNWAKRLAVEMLNQNIILPITMQIVGSMPSLFGIQAPASGGQTITLNGQAYTAANNSSGGLGSLSNLFSLGSNSTGSGMFGNALSGIKSSISESLFGSPGHFAASNAEKFIPGTDGILGSGGQFLGIDMSQISSGPLSIIGIGGSILGGYGAKLLGGNETVGSIGGSMIGGIPGALLSTLFPQKVSVGKTASADVTTNPGGKSATFGNIQTDNDGDAEAGKALGTAISSIFTIAAAGGGKLTKDFGFGQTAKDGFFISGSVPYQSFGKDIAAMMRYALLDQGGLSGAGANVTAALRNTKATDFDELSKDVALGASIDAGTTALAALDKSLNSFTKSAKETTAEAMKPMFEELERAKKLGIDGAYKNLATDQLKAYLDQLKNPVDFTQREQDMASLTGQFQAIREAVAQLNPAMATYVDQIEAETRARIKAQTAQEATVLLNEAMGRGYLNQIKDLEKARDINARNLAAVGLDVSTAGDIFNASLTSLLRGLDDASLSVVAQSFTGDIATLATTLRNASSAAVSFATDVAGRVQTALGNDRGASLIALDAQQAAALATARASGYDTTTLQQVQATERAAQAFKLAQADVLAAYDQQIAAQQDYVAALTDGAVKLAQSAREFRSAYDALALNDNSPLNAKDRLEEARRQFGTALTTYRDVASTAEDRDAAKQTLLSLGPSLVQLAKGFLGSTDTTDYDYVRSVFAELGDTTAMGVDTADKQLEAANATLKEMQRQRADAAAMGQKQYGALSDLNSIMTQSYGIWQAQLTALQASTGATSSTSPSTYVDSSVEAKRTRLQAFTNADIERTFGGFSDIIAARAADPSFNLALWFKTFGINEVLAGTRKIPGFATGTLSTPPGAVWVGEQGPELLWQGGAAAVASSVDSLRIAKAFEAANDRWSGNVTPLRSAGASTISTRGIEQRLDRAVAVLERVVEAIDAGNEEAVPALKTLARQAGRSPEPLGRRIAVTR